MPRHTMQRQAIQAVFDASDRPMGPSEVHLAAQRTAPALGMATVYRAIKDLLEDNWLVSVELPGEPPRYERAGKHHHHHFHCSNCDRVFEAKGCNLSLQRLVPQGFTLTAHELVLYGLCAGCVEVAPSQAIR
ncbi:MAG TPA: transcriptional repressor [Polyangiaceae bacterium]